MNLGKRSVVDKEVSRIQNISRNKFNPGVVAYVGVFTYQIPTAIIAVR